MKPVKSKTDFTKRFIEGEFGNRGPTWHSLSDWRRDAIAGKVNKKAKFHLRNRKPNSVTKYNISFKKMWALSKYLKEPSFYVAEMCPTEKTIFQGELQRLPSCGLYLRFSLLKKPMREALTESQIHVTGLLAKELLSEYMCPRSYEWVEELLENYPDHTIEFSTFGINWGTIPDMNTVFWEVRRY